MPVTVNTRLWIDLDAPQCRPDFRRVAADLGLDGIGQRVRGVGRDDERPCPPSPAESAVAAAIVVLPTPPFPP